MKLTPAQKRAIDFALADGELEVGGLDGRPVQRRTADGLVDKGLFTRRPVDPIRGINAYALVKNVGKAWLMPDHPNRPKEAHHE